MGQQTNMSSSTGLQQNQQQQPPPQQQQAHAAKKGSKRTSYNAEAMDKIRDSLRPFEQQQKQQQESKIQHLVSIGYEEDVARRMFAQNTKPDQDFNGFLSNGNNGPPALPPRTRLKETPPRVPDHVNSNEIPPPPPPPRGNANPPPTPPRGATPPPHHPASGSSNSQAGYTQIGSTNPPPLLRRMSPVPVSHASRISMGAITPSIPANSQRGTSPITAAFPVRVPNTKEIQQQLAQTMQSMSIFPVESGAEPPPPYPMGIAATSNPPPSYSQSLAMRQSPTLSSSSSDYRRSPGPYHANVLSSYPIVPGNLSSGVKNSCNTPTSPIPASSPASSMMSSSSRTSSMQACSSRQAKTHSPIIMQSVKSTQVQKPILQTATAVDPSGVETSSLMNKQPPPLAGKEIDKSSPAPPPPSYEFSMQQKQHLPPLPPPSPVISEGSSSPNLVIHRAVSPAQPVPASQFKLPPPPPYPSTKVSLKDCDSNMVNATQVSAKAGPVIISTAKVVSNRSDSKKVVQRTFSPQGSDASSSLTASRSESPLSDSQTVSTSPISFMSTGPTSYSQSDQITASDSESLPSRTTHHMSPKPERKQLSPEKEETRRESLIRNCPPEAYKFFMEQRIENVIKAYDQRKHRQRTLEHELVQFDFHKDPTMSDKMRGMLRKQETNYLRMKRAKLNKEHFKKIKKIGVGAFGEVSLVQAINPVNRKNELYAMKTLKKSHVVEKNQVARVIAEEDILAEADNDWIVKLYYSFQDKDNLYFVMEYIPGGDLMNLLIHKETFDEDLARFYIAELTCAVESVHSMGFIHRDIKPDNILIDAEGHIKLTDFGLCTGFRWTHNSKYYPKNNSVSHCRQDSMDPGTLDLESGKCSCAAIGKGMKPLERRKLQQKQRCMAHSLVGTPNYIAPEVLCRDEKGYTQSCDWWSVGVILYEMVIGQPPFHAESPAMTQRKVLNWSECLRIPNQPRISSETEHLIRGLITSADVRLGSLNGSQEIKNHPFFAGINFNKPIRHQKAPHKPKINHPLDTSNFDTLEEANENGNSDESLMLAKDYPSFFEFTFRRFFNDYDHSMTLQEPSSHASNGTAKAAPDTVYV